MDLENKFYIQSQFLQLVEPLMEKYYDLHSSMLIDEIKHCIENSSINYISFEDGIPNAYYQKTFYENKQLRAFPNSNYPYKDIADEYTQYFDFESKGKDQDALQEDAKVYLCLSYIGYIYYKEKEGLFEESILIEALNLEYQSVLHTKIYPEMLSLYRMILESKKYKKRGDKVTITYKQDKIDINTSAWFLDDMEAYFKDRFPNLTLEDINELLPLPNKKGGRKFTDRTVNNIIWGTYQLLYNHHSQFKNSKVKISKEICDFIIQYLNYLNIKHDYVDTDIKDKLKDMIKRNYIPKWDLPWRNVFSSIEEKQPESELERLNQPLRKYDLSNL
ncbi:hypothetical protein [Dysgonomonas sp. ZJ279]|uniref:hypothetical protein n=1 Tax=Dysgonomonas sp. ZJ279 TaxID=2709796 RepID=UPI0013ED94E7|nr:hypothetical protein [Dysgonomonas sp. ZJ279]